MTTEGEGTPAAALDRIAARAQRGRPAEIARIASAGTSGIVMLGLVGFFGLTDRQAAPDPAVVLSSTRAMKPHDRPASLLAMHRWLSSLVIAGTAIHVVALVADNYVQFGLVEMLIPMTSGWRPVAVAFGSRRCTCSWRFTFRRC